MKKLFNLIPAISIAVVMLASHPAAAAANAVSVVGTINGGGTSIMTDLPAGMNVTSFGIHATLFSDGSARGHFNCVDHMGDVPGYPGNIWGDITRWSGDINTGLVTLYITGKVVGFPGGHPVDVEFTVTIQSYGGAGVGHWTLDFPPLVSPFNGGPICQELLTSGQIRWN